MENTISSRVSIVSDEPEELSKTLDSDSATRSLCSSPYSQKLLTLSPRTSKGNYKFNLSPDFRIASSGETGLGATICSGESSSSSNDSGYLTTPIEMHTQFDFHRKPSMETESNADDIDFFLQVVGVFRDYIADQICILESRFKENKQNLEVLQGQLKANENVASQQETQLVRDFSNLISLLHQKQSELQRLLKRQSVEVGEKIRGQSDICRGNIKMVSGILNFAKRLRNESGESMRENAVREFKQRLLSANDLPTADLNIASDSSSRINLEAISKLIQNIQFQSVQGKELKVERNGTTTNDKCNKCKMIPPAILAAQSDDDITKTSLTVRWTCCANCESEYGLKWSYKLKDKTIEKSKENVTATSYVIHELPSNVEVTVNVRHSNDETNTSWSPCAIFKTKQSPANFSFDVNTAHVKLKLSPDAKSVFYPGDDYNNASPKSPSRFTFALNVLGNISFYSGRHYWEVQVNRDGWAVGVAYRGVPRNSWLGSNNSSWILHYNPARFEYKVRHAGEAVEIIPKLSNSLAYLKRVGIFINYEAGLVKFVDCVNKEIMHTYMVEAFEQPLCAAANPFYHGGCLTLLSGLDIPNFITEV